MSPPHQPHPQPPAPDGEAPDARLLDAERFWRLSVDLLSVAGLDGYFKRVNPALVQTVGWSERELLTTPFIEFLHPDDVPTTEAAVAKLAEGATLVDHENRFRCRDGSYRWFSSRTIREDDALYNVTRDVTEPKAAAAEAERQRQLLQRIIDNAPVVIAYLNRDLVFQWANAFHAEALGMPPDHFAGRTPDEVYGPTAAAQIVPIMREVLESGEARGERGFPFHYEVDGQPRATYWDFTFQPVREGGVVVGVLPLAQEVSERVERERLQQEYIHALEEADHLKDQFLGIVSHELRTPINAIMGFGSILEDELDGPLNAEQRAHVRKILTGSEALLALVTDLLDMSRIQAGKFLIAPSDVDVAPLAADAVANLGPAAEAKGITLRNEVAPGLPHVRADEQRAMQVLANLIGNATKFTQEGGWIEVRARVDGAFVRVEVEDNGPGIAKADQERLFDPFVQADMSNTRRSGGVGLGLSICKSLIEAHGGRIGCGSDRGKGATFWFTLPRADGGPG